MKITYFDFAILNHQLGSLLKSGLGLSDGLRAIARDMRDPQFRGHLEAMAADVETGTPLSAAIAKHPETFPAYYAPILKASEASGTTREVLMELGNQAQSLDRLRRQFATIFIYPALVMLIGILIGLYMFAFVFPIFKEMYDAMGNTLPLATQLAFLLGYSLRYLAIALLVAVAAATLALLYSLHRYHPKIQRWVEQWIARIPVVGTMYFHFAIVHFLKLLQILLKTRTPLKEALESAARGANNLLLQAEIQGMARQLEEGKTLPEALKNCRIMPQTLVWLLAIGSRESTFEDNLQQAGELFELKTEVYSATIASVAEPAIILAVGATVGFFIISLYAPLFSIVSVIV